jgi:hypothetical protein
MYVEFITRLNCQRIVSCFVFLYSSHPRSQGPRLTLRCRVSREALGPRMYSSNFSISFPEPAFLGKETKALG